MLYDNALLLRAYNYGYLLTHKPLYKYIAYDIVRFLKRELKSPEGGFYTALDADSEGGVEGKYYVFSKDEIVDALGDQGGDQFCKDYDISASGNFEGQSIPNLIGKEATDEWAVKHSDSLSKLLAYRDQRVKPLMDDKILISTNSQLLSSLSYMYRIYGDSELLMIARDIAGFIELNLVDQDTVSSSITKGKVNVNCVLDDYAFYIEGLIDLYEANMDINLLNQAKSLTKAATNDFWNGESGGYYLTSDKGGEKLIRRPMESYDGGAIPSGNSVMALNLLRLSRLTDNLEYQNQYDALIKRFGSHINKGPSFSCYMLLSLLHRQEGTQDLVIAVPEGHDLSDVLEHNRLKSLRYFTFDIRIKKGDKKNL